MSSTKRGRSVRSKVARGLILYAIPRSGTHGDVAEALDVSRTRVSHFLTDEPDNLINRMVEFVMGLAEKDSTSAREFAEALNRAVLVVELFYEPTEKLIERARYLRSRINILRGREAEVGQNYFMGNATAED